MRGVWGRWLIALALVPIGCAAPQKKKPSPPVAVPAADPNRPFWAADNGSPTASIPSRGDPINTPANDPEISGILAGRVVDAFQRPVTVGSIQVIEMATAAPRPPTEIELEPNNQGRFYIRGLQPGRTYRLIARGKGDGRLLVGEVQAKPPESRLLIPVTEDFASGTTPPIPTAPEQLNPRRPAPAPATGPAAPPSDAATDAGLGAPRGGEPNNRPDQNADSPGTGAPRGNTPTPAPPPPGLPAIGSDDVRRAPIEPQSYSGGGAAAAVAPMVPSCLVQAGRLRYMALKDLDGQVWDFGQRRGQIVLLDFWGTWCTPCLRALPEVARLHGQYADRGLEVIGVACEKVGPGEGRGRVRQAQSRISGLNYRILLADEYGRCPVQAQFQINSYPTLVLLDADGAILWRGNDVAEAERQIRRRLGY